MRGSRVLFTALSVEWATPQAVYDALHAEFAFDYDPCPLDGTVDGLLPQRFLQGGCLL